MYFSIRYGISFIMVLEEWEKHLMKPKDYIYSVIILSFVFSIIFPSIRTFYIQFLAPLLLEMNVNVFEKYDHRKISIFKLKNKAILENNSTMYSFCVDKELERRKQYIAYSAFWAIIVFMFIQYIISDIPPFLLTLYNDIYTYLNSGVWLLKILFFILVFSIGMPLLIFLGSSFFLHNDDIYLPIEKDDK